MVKISNASYEDEIHREDSPFNEDSKIYIFGQRSSNFGEGTAGKFREMAQTRKPIVMQISEWSILIGNTNLYSQVPKSSHCFGLPVCYIKLFAKNCKSQFQAKYCLNFAALPSLNEGYFSNFDKWAIVLCHILALAKISLKNLFLFLKLFQKSMRGSFWPPPP